MTGCRFRVDKIDDCIVPTYSGKECREAVMIFFGLSDKRFDHLFIETSYDGPTRGVEGARSVAARVRRLVSQDARRKSKRTVAVVEQIKRRALEPVE